MGNVKLVPASYYRRDATGYTPQQQSKIEDYARFCIECDRKEMKPLIFVDYLKI
jgi:hypothetical protein